MINMKNEYEIKNGLVKISVVRKNGERHIVIIDEEDFESIDKINSKIYVVKECNTYYACFKEYLGNRKTKTIYLHRFLVGFPSGKVVDHADGNGLNNRRSNIRVCTRSENQQNKFNKIQEFPRGVHFHKIAKKYQARVKMNNKHYHLGLFEEIEDASAACIKFRKENMPFSNEKRNKFSKEGSQPDGE